MTHGKLSTSLRVHRDTYEAIAEQARMHGVSVTFFVNCILRDFCEQKRPLVITIAMPKDEEPAPTPAPAKPKSISLAQFTDEEQAEFMASDFLRIEDWLEDRKRKEALRAWGDDEDEPADDDTLDQWR